MPQQLWRHGAAPACEPLACRDDWSACRTERTLRDRGRAQVVGSGVSANGKWNLRGDEAQRQFWTRDQGTEHAPVVQPVALRPWQSESEGGARANVRCGTRATARARPGEGRSGLVRQPF